MNINPKQSNLISSFFCIGVSDWRNNGGKVFVDSDDNKKLVDFWDVRHGRDNGSMVIIDVRNPRERILPGSIKKTVNIPCEYHVISY